MITRILLIFVCVVFSAFFSMTETAYSSLNTVRLKAKSEKGRKYALAFEISEDFENFLGAVLIGNNLVNVAASSIATVIIVSLFGEEMSFLSTLIMTVIILIFGEITPKIIGKRLSEKVAVNAALPVKILAVIFSPVIFAAKGLVKLFSPLWKNQLSETDSYNEEDLENIIDIAEDEGVIDEDKSDLIQNVLDFGDLTAYEVITPRVDMVAVDIRDPIDKNINILLSSPYSRIPVYEDTPDKIIGILHLNRLFKEMSDGKEIALRPLLMEPVFIYKTMPLFDVLGKMQENKCHMAVVLDEYGGTAGIITMEDILEQIVGEIWDESDEVIEEFTCIDDTHFEASGDMRLEDFFDEFELETDEERDENVTLGGFAMDILEGEVKKGDTFTYKNLLFTVLEYENFRIERLSIEEIPISDGEE